MKNRMKSRHTTEQAMPLTTSEASLIMRRWKPVKVAILGRKLMKSPFQSGLMTLLADLNFSLLMKMEPTLKKMVMSRKMLATVIYPERL